MTEIQGDVYRWEDNAGLDHKCGICHTVLSAAKAKYSCFGKHEEPCPKYHKTLFYIGNSHVCEAEQQYKRLSDLATVVQKIEEIDQNDFDELASPKSPKFAEDKALNRLSLGELNLDGSKMNVQGNQKKNQPWTPRPGKKKDKKAEKKLEKATRRSINIPKSPLERVAEALKSPRTMVPPMIIEHNMPATTPDARDPEKETPAEGLDAELNRPGVRANINFNPRLGKSSAVPGSKKLQKLDAKLPLALRPRREIDPTAFLVAMNISPRGIGPDKERKALIKELLAAVREHVTAEINEERETEIREAGYWRYVGQKTRQHMLKNNKRIVWGTGERVQEQTEEASKDD